MNQASGVTGPGCGGSPHWDGHGFQYFPIFLLFFLYFLLIYTWGVRLYVYALVRICVLCVSVCLRAKAQKKIYSWGVCLYVYALVRICVLCVSVYLRAQAQKKICVSMHFHYLRVSKKSIKKKQAFFVMVSNVFAY